MPFVTLVTNFVSKASAATIGTPIAHQTNLLIMSEGGHESGDHVRAGLPLAGLMVTRLPVLLVIWYGL